MSDILSVIDRRQGYAFEPLVKPAAPIVPTLDPRLDALLMRFDEKYARKEQKKESQAGGLPSLSDLVKAQNELPNAPGGEQAFIKMESDVLRGMGINPETGSRLPSPKSASAASSEIPMPFLSIPPPVEEAPIKRVPKMPPVAPPGSGKQEAIKDSGNEINMARVLKYDRERLDKLTRASQAASGVEFQKLQQAAIKARNAWLKLNNLQEFGRASPENVSNFKI